MSNQENHKKESSAGQMNKREVNMLEGSIFRELLVIAVPIILSSILQQLFNAADVAVVGRFSSSEAMAAVGANAPVINMVVTLFTGLSVGSNVLIAAFIGQNRKEKVSDAVHTSFSLALLSGVIMMIIGFLISRPVLEMLDTPDNVIDLALVYLRIYFLGTIFVMIYNFGSAILRSIGDTKRPLICLIISGVLNVFLNLFFVIVCGMSADGVALATTISNGVSAVLVMVMLMREKGMLHLDLRRLSLRPALIKRIVVIGGPAGLQGMIFALSNVVIQAAVNSFGSACIAGNSAALNYEYISYFVVYGYAQAVMTFISQNYAAQKYDRCRSTARVSFLSAVAFTAIVSVTFYALRYPLIHIFSTDEEVVRFAMIRMFYIMLLEPMTATYEIPAASLRGIGHSMVPALVTLIGCCGLRLAYICLLLHRFTSFDQVLLIYPASWVVTAVVMITLYFRITRKAYAQ